jgi:hypothetical protein
VLVVDGVYCERDQEVLFHALPHLSTREVGEVLEKAVRRIARWLARRGLLGDRDGAELEPAQQEHAALCASAVSGHAPPAGPELRRRGPLATLEGASLRWPKALCANLDGFTLHAATRAGAIDAEGRMALLKYVLRPPIAQERVTQGPDGLVRIALKRPFADGTIALDLDPLSLIARLAATVPTPGTHTVRYAGILGSASKLRARIVPKPSEDAARGLGEEPDAPRKHGCRYRSWAELLRTLGIDGLLCPKCAGRMRVLSLVRDPQEVRRLLRAMGEPTEPPERAPARGPPYWASRVLRVRSGTDAA